MVATETAIVPSLHRLTRGNGVVAYRDYANVGAPLGTVMLVHGLASFGRQFEADAQYFSGLGYRVIVPDLRGHGVSQSLSRASSADFSIAALADDLVAVLEHAGVERVHWVGNSLGGILALHLLGTEARGRIASLVLFGTCLSMNLPRLVPLALRAAFLPGRAITGWLTARSTTPDVGGRALIAEAIGQLDVGAAAAIAGHVRHYDFVENARAFGGPLLVLRGGQDKAVNLRLGGDLRRLGAERFEMIELAGGHCANLDVPVAFRAALLAHWQATGDQA